MIEIILIVLVVLLLLGGGWGYRTGYWGYGGQLPGVLIAVVLVVLVLILLSGPHLVGVWR